MPLIFLSEGTQRRSNGADLEAGVLNLFHEEMALGYERVKLRTPRPRTGAC